MRHLAVAILFAASACAAPPARDPSQVSRPRTSANTARIGTLALGTGLAASGFGGVTMAIGNAFGPKDTGGQIVFYVGVGTLVVGVVSTTIALVVLTVAAVQYDKGD